MELKRLNEPGNGHDHGTINRTIMELKPMSTPFSDISEKPINRTIMELKLMNQELLKKQIPSY